MDKLLGSIIDDYTLYRIIEGIITILVLVTVYLGIQISLTMKFPKKGTSDDTTSQKKRFTRSSIFIFTAGFFMIIHEFLEGLKENAPDYTTYEFIELLAFSALVLFLYDWHKILKNQKR